MSERAIGGFFELELLDRGSFMHDDGVLLNSGRNALSYVLRSLPDIKHIWIPYYTCDVVWESIRFLGIAHTFYSINEKLEIQDSIALQAGDYLLYTNYFGVKDCYVQRLAERFGSRLIVDNAQAWYAEPIYGVSTIYSPRKYVGVPDGGIAYCSNGIDIEQFEQDQSFDRCSHLLKRIDLGATDGYLDFKENSRSLAMQPIRRMSKLTERLLRSIDFEVVKQRRKENFLYLCGQLGKANLFCIPDLSSFACPMVYPFLTNNMNLKQKLIDKRVYIATYWPNVYVWAANESVEMEFATQLVSLPCDQRYDRIKMDFIVQRINECLY